MRRLPPNHEQVLLDSLARAEKNAEPIGINNTQSTRGLVIRGLLEARDYIDHNGRKRLGFYLTDEGYRYLKNNPNIYPLAPKQSPQKQETS